MGRLRDPDADDLRAAFLHNFFASALHDVVPCAPGDFLLETLLQISLEQIDWTQVAQVVLAAPAAQEE